MKQEFDEQLQGRVFINGNLVNDNRIRIGTDIEQQPYNSLAFLKCEGEISENIVQYGTAFMIAERYALTNAHLLFDKTQAKQKIIKPYKRMKIYPKANGQIMIPNPKIKSQVQPNNIIDFRAYSKIKEDLLTMNTRMDIAVVKLERPVPQKKYIKLGIESTPNDLYGKTVVSAGYPYDKFSSGKNMGTVVECYIGNGQIFNVNEQYNTFDHNIPTQKGQSGSPILLYINDKIFCIGLHKSYKKSKKINCGLLFSLSILKTIYDWIWDMQTPIFNIYKLQDRNFSALNSKEYIKGKEQLKNQMKIKHISSLKQDHASRKKIVINWSISSYHKQFLQINGPYLSKKTNDKNAICIYSHEYFILNSVSYCVVQLQQVIGSIFIGISNKKHQNFKQKSNLQLVYNSCLIDLEAKPQPLNKIAISYKKYNNKQVKNDYLTFNSITKHKIMTEVDYFKNEIRFSHNNQRKISLQINEAMTNQKLYLVIALLSQNDSIKLVSNETIQF